MKAASELQGDDVRAVFEAVLPDEALDAIVTRAKFQERQRKLDAKLFLRAMVVSAASGAGGRQADAARMYFETGGARVVRGAHYAWYTQELETTMEGVRDRAFAFGAALRRDLPDFLDGLVRDVHVVDSMTVRLSDSLKDVYPAAGDYAALKVHKRFSVGIGTTVDYHLSPAREHDSPHLVIDDTWRGLGLLVDLGYASHRLIEQCEKHGVLYVMRLKENWKPKVERIVSGLKVARFVAGSDLEVILHDGDFEISDDEPIDADVTLGRGAHAVRARLVAVEHDGVYRFYLTNMPSRVQPAQAVDLYRVRWEIESDNKLDKSCMHLDGIDARKPHAARALVHASMIASMLVCFLAHQHRLREGHAKVHDRQRRVAPIHPQSLGRMLAVMAMRIATTMDLPSHDADAQWAFIAATLLHQGRDPNWRRSPSILDQLRGWTTTPGTPRKQRAASVDHPAPSKNTSKSAGKAPK